MNTTYSPPAAAAVVDPQIADHDLAPAQSDVDDFLRKKRKVREHKACYPCRQRKVKCDLSRPCQTCRDRDHPELCSYHPPSKRQQHTDTGGDGPTLKVEDQTGGGHIILGRGEFDLLCAKLSGLENNIAELRQELKRNSADRDGHHELEGPLGGEDYTSLPGQGRPLMHTDVHGIHTRNDQGEIVHLGGGSIPALLYGLGQNQDSSHLQELLGKSVLPLFGLDNESATYPFVDLWGLPHASLGRAEELAKALPNDTQLQSLVQQYKIMGHVMFPGIPDIEAFDAEVQTFLIDRASNVNSKRVVTEQMICGKTYYWLGVLFAVLASGAQCSHMPRKERELTSQVYVCCSFECLRFTNFLSQPKLENIQALLLIGNTMANNMNAGIAWSLLGLTIRLAQGLGLHRSCPPNVPTSVVFPRSRVWWAIIWQDSLLSITYDRATSTAATDLNTMPMPQDYATISPYHVTMYHLTKCGLDIVHDRCKALESHDLVARISEHQTSIAEIMKDAAEYLRDSRKCSSTRETLEHWALYLHQSYALSELYRPAISRHRGNPELQVFKSQCVDNLANTVEAYLGLNNITPYARQSWAAMHRALSSALILGILGEHHRSERVRRLIARLISIMDQVSSTFDPSEITVSVQRGIAALRRLHITEPLAYASMSQDESSMDKDRPLPELMLDWSGNGNGTVITPSTNAETGSGGDEHSPYSVLNRILWNDSEITHGGEFSGL